MERKLLFYQTNIAQMTRIGKDQYGGQVSPAHLGHCLIQIPPKGGQFAMPSGFPFIAHLASTATCL